MYTVKSFAQHICAGRHSFFKAIVFSSPLLLASCQKVHDHLPWNKTDGEVVYVETNDFANNNNALLAYMVS